MSKTKLLLDLVNDVRSVADDLQAIADALSQDEPAPEQPREEKKEEKKAEPEKAIRLEDVRAVLAAKSREGYGDKVRELIKTHGGTRLSDISPSEYGAMLKEAEVFGSAT